MKQMILIALALTALCAVVWQSSLAQEEETAVPEAPFATIGSGTAASCQTNTAINAFSAAVAAGGTIDFNCGPNPVSIKVNTSVTDKTVTVNGGERITLSGEDLRQIFLLTGSANLTLNDITLIDGSAGQGGAVYIGAQARATINRSFLTSNSADTLGGAIYNLGTLTINRTSLGSNSAGNNGGAIYNSGGTVNINDSYLIGNQAVNGAGLYTVNGQTTLIRSAFRSNTSSSQGGGLSAFGNTQITNVTFSNNRALQGGGLYSGSSVITVGIVNATFSENRADIGGAILRNSASTVTVRNSIIANSRNSNDTSPSLNCDGPALTSQGRNIISDNSCMPNPSASGDLHGTNPQLGPWLGSPTRAYIPASNSPALDYAQNCPPRDQRLYPRPLGPGCDVGSIERGAVVYLPFIRG
jgi:predicted outer membrane repeat protein